VETRTILAEFGGDGRKYRAYVEAGKGEKTVSPFERAVAGLALGGEEFANRIRRMVAGRRDTGEQPSLRALRRESMAEPERVEEAVNRVFPEAGPARLRRLRIYALRRYSRLRPVEIARRHARRPSAVTEATRDLEAEAARKPDFRDRLAALARELRLNSEN
jgi:hypothetical protein